MSAHSGGAGEETGKTGKKKSNTFLKLNLPGMGLLRKFHQYRRLPQEPPTHHLEEELGRLTYKIDNLLSRLDHQDQELAVSQEEECVVCGTNRATMQTFPCGHQVVCRQCFVKTIQMAVAQKRLPLRCILCRSKVLRLKQNHKGKGKGDRTEQELPKSVSGYNLDGRISNSASNYSFSSGVSSVSSESGCSRKSSFSKEFSFSSLSNFQNVNLLNKSQIPRSTSGGFSARRSRRSRSPSPAGGSRSRSAEASVPRIKIDRTPSDDSLYPALASPASPASPSSPGWSLPGPRSRSPGSSGSRSPRSPASPTSPVSPGQGEERVFSSRGSSRLSTPLSPIKESRIENGSLLELYSSPDREKKSCLQLQPVPKKPSTRIKCAEKIIAQLEIHANIEQSKAEQELEPSLKAWSDQVKRASTLKKLSNEEISCFENLGDEDGQFRTRVKTSKSVTFKDC